MAKKFEPTEEEREKVKLLAIVGTPQPLICRLIKRPGDKKPLTDKTLRKHFAEELETGTAEANALVGQTAFNMASSGAFPSMTMFWMKCRAHWRETTVVQSQQLDSDGNPIEPPSFGITFPNGGPGQPAPDGASEELPEDETYDEANAIAESDSDDPTGTPTS